MPWVLARVTTNLTDDGDWRGLAANNASAPDESIFFPVGRGGARVDTQHRIQIAVGWLNAIQQPVAGAGTSLTVEPVIKRSLPLPLPSGTTQTIDILHVGEAREASAWVPLFLDIGAPSSRAAFRLTSMVYASATRVAAWYWMEP